MLDLSQDARLDVLKHLHSRAYDQISFHRQRQDKIFLWSSNVFLLVIGALLIVDQATSVAWSGQGFLGKTVASVAILVLLVFSMRWQQRNREWQEESVEVLDNIEHLFHCFDEAYFGTPDGVPLFPKRWEKQPGSERRLNLAQRIVRVNYVSATFLLGILTIAMIWFSGQ